MFSHLFMLASTFTKARGITELDFKFSREWLRYSGESINCSCFVEDGEEAYYDCSCLDYHEVKDVEFVQIAKDDHIEFGHTYSKTTYRSLESSTK